MDCPCLTDENAPECRVKSPQAVEDELIGGAITAWGYCTRGMGHDGDHIRCGGQGSGEVHEIERWRNDACQQQN